MCATLVSQGVPASELAAFGCDGYSSRIAQLLLSLPRHSVPILTPIFLFVRCRLVVRCSMQ